jgi:arylformamidase
MLIDLSVQLDSDTPAYPGDPHIRIEQSERFETDGYVGHAATLGTHTGTHIDAPAHMIPGAPTLGDVPLDTFSGTGKVVNGLSLTAARSADIQPGDIVLFYTGMSDQYYDPSYFTNYPVMPDELVDYLISQRVKLVGLDTCSADNQPGFPIHKKLLGASIPIIENLTNLASLANNPFQVYALPLKFNLDGAPARVVAQVGA